MAGNSNPNEAQRNQLAKEVGLEPKQIKSWFDNKRATLKVIVFKISLLFFFSLTHITCFHITSTNYLYIFFTLLLRKNT